MSILKRTVTFIVLAATLGAAPASAQGTSAFQWYVGGHGGVMSFRTPTQGRTYLPMAGGQILITARRTGLLLSVDQAFGSGETTSSQFVVSDTSGVLSSGTLSWTFEGIRKYSAILLAYPVRNRNIQPFIGVGGGILHTTANSPGPLADGSVESDLSSTGFGTAVAGLEFRAGPFSAFGQYQITTKHGFKQTDAVLQTGASGEPIMVRSDFGEWMTGANHSVSGGLRIGLGSAKD